ncbi:MAG: hypothetical protein ABSC18_07270 [Verrucomicrobiota bacterium]
MEDILLNVITDFSGVVDSQALTPYPDRVNSTIAAPVDWIEAVGKLRFPTKADRRLQELMDSNNEGLLRESEREELEALVELSEQLSLVRGEALHILGAYPQVH